MAIAPASSRATTTTCAPVGCSFKGRLRWYLAERARSAREKRLKSFVYDLLRIALFPLLLRRLPWDKALFRGQQCLPPTHPYCEVRSFSFFIYCPPPQTN